MNIRKLPATCNTHRNRRTANGYSRRKSAWRLKFCLWSSARIASYKLKKQEDRFRKTIRRLLLKLDCRCARPKLLHDKNYWNWALAFSSSKDLASRRRSPPPRGPSSWSALSHTHSLSRHSLVKASNFSLAALDEKRFFMLRTSRWLLRDNWLRKKHCCGTKMESTTKREVQLLPPKNVYCQQEKDI